MLLQMFLKKTRLPGWLTDDLRYGLMFHVLYETLMNSLIPFRILVYSRAKLNCVVM